MTANTAAAPYLLDLFAGTTGLASLSWWETPRQPGPITIFHPLDDLVFHASAMNGRTHAAYVRMTTVETEPGKGRGGADVAHEAVALFADLDYGDIGHEGDPPGGLRRPADAEEALTLIETLPEPTMVVNSGGGLYPIWQFAEPWVLDDETRPLAHSLNKRWNVHIAAVAKRQGLHHGPGISDLARILRLPGSVNHKDPDRPRPCTVIRSGGPRYTVEQLQHALDEAVETETMIYGTPAPSEPAQRSSYTDEERDEFDFRDSGDDMGGVFQRFEAVVGIPGVLFANGWTECGCGERPDVEQCFTRPGGGSTTQHSAHILSAQPHVLVVHSANTALPDGAGHRLTAGRIYAILEHDGDESAAASALIDLERGDGGKYAEYGWGNRSLISALFDATPIIRHIRTAAHSRKMDETGVFLNVLGLRACQIPVDRKIPAVVAVRANLNLVLGTVGESSSGKSSAHELALELLGADPSHIKGLGSGQGISEQYMDDIVDPENPTRKIRGAVHGRAWFFYEDEVSAIASKGDVASDAMLGEVRKAWSGTHLGQSNATKDRNRNVPSGSYRFVLMTNIQPGRSGGLFTDAQIQGGTPQRFVLLPAQLASAEEWKRRWKAGELPDDPGPLELPTTEFADGDFEINDQTIVDEIVDVYFDSRENLEGSLRGHRQLAKLKVAAVLADLHGEGEITRQWWELAETVMRISDHQVDVCRSALAANRAKENKAIGTALAHQQFETTRTRDELEDAELDGLQQTVLELLAGGNMSRTDFKGRISAGRRRRLPEALEALVEDGRVEVVKIPTSGRTREVIRLTDREDVT